MMRPLTHNNKRLPSKSTPPPSPPTLTSTWTALSTALSSAVFNRTCCDGNMNYNNAALKSFLVKSQVRGRLSIVKKARSMLPRSASPLACKRLHYLERDLCSFKQIASDCKHSAASALKIRMQKRPRISKLNLPVFDQSTTVSTR